MGFTDSVLMHMFGHPKGLLGRLGGRLMEGKGEVYRWVLTLLAVKPTDHILEVGFGPGVGIKCAAEATPNGFVAGVDYSEVMLHQARKRNAAAIQAGRVALMHGSATALPHKDQCFDKALSVNSLHLWPDAIQGLREMWRVLKPGGSVAIMFTPHAKQSGERLVGMLTQAGFQQAHLEKSGLGVCALAHK
ncbi:MAG TPA: class I SAM-dependent methyltransferase [Symbiobacteriaceae bacterium]|nr:class I SAM-dependent methyltransferase [Symbiobacteriaceae bacterium]